MASLLDRSGVPANDHVFDENIFQFRLTATAVMPRRDISSWNCSHEIRNGSPGLDLRLVTPGLLAPKIPVRTSRKMVSGGQVFQQAGDGQRRFGLLKQPSSPPGGMMMPRFLVAGDLRQRIEVAQRIQFVAEELQAHRPRAGQAARNPRCRRAWRRRPFAVTCASGS